MYTNSDTKVGLAVSATGIANKDKQMQPTKSSLLFSVVIVIVIILALLSLLMSIIVIAVHQNKFQQSDMDIEYLRVRITQLEQCMETMATKQTVTQQHTSNLKGELLQLQSQQNSAITDLRRNLTTTRHELSFRISHSETEFHQLLNDNRDEIEFINGELLEIKGNITNTQEQISAAVNLYDNCTVHTETCTIDRLGGDFYWRLCGTSSVPIYMEGYYTTDMICTYESPHAGVMVSTVLDKRNKEVMCKCNVIKPDHYRDNFYELPDDIRAVCTMVVTRCPTSQQLIQ